MTAAHAEQSAQPQPFRQPFNQPSSQPLQPTSRTTVVRGTHRVVTDREVLHQILREALVVHLGVLVGEPGEQYPVVLPVAHGLDLAGPDDQGTLYLHGSVASHWMLGALEAQVCVTATELDGLVLANRAFDHSMNYRCAVVLGTARRVEDQHEKAHALALIVDHSVPGRRATLPPDSRKEVAATQVFAVSLREASVKVRAGGPGGEEAEQGWAGHIPVRRAAGQPVPAPWVTEPVPAHVSERARALAGGADPLGSMEP